MESEGLYFYFLGWISWIVVMFFFSKSRLRTVLSSVILSAMVASSSYLQIYQFQVNLSFLLLALTAFVLLVLVLKKNYFIHYVSISTISLAYVCFNLFEIYDPVWIMIDRTWLLASILLYLTLLLFKSRAERFVFLLTGAIQGELLTGFVWNSVFSYPIVGAYEFLAVLSLSMAGLSTWMLFGNITVYLDSMIQKRVKEKQG